MSEMSTSRDRITPREPASAALSVPSSAAKGKSSNTAAQVRKKSEKLDSRNCVGPREGGKKEDNSENVASTSCQGNLLLDP